MWTTEKLRQTFLEYFNSLGHTTIPSSSVVPKNDPSLLFTNSGMVQFKKFFLGSPTDLKRACSVQRCIRAGGKHNDLDDVGKDNYHHTYFEMLGNWSFGDYGKKEAIDFSYDFLVKSLKLSPERLYVTYYGEMDTESKVYWSKYFPENHIISSSYQDNFWEMGDTGPCGPCTEIHYDRIGGRDASHLVNKDDPDVLEIWNIVFIEYNRVRLASAADSELGFGTGDNPATSLVPLEKKCIDTGIGLERLLSILMNVRSNYLIDTFQIIIREIEKYTSFRYTDTESKTDMAFRVISDHCRTITVCLNDNVEFANEGVGYVMRRILRRALRFSNEVLEIEEGVFPKLVKCAGKAIGLDVDVAVVCKEEKQFMKTLRKGIERFNRLIDVKLGRFNEVSVEGLSMSSEGLSDSSINQGKLLSQITITAEDVYLLYDTYGFPTDLTQILARERGISIDLAGFENLKHKNSQKIRTLSVTAEKTQDIYKYTDNGISAAFQFSVYEGQLYDYILPQCGVVFDKTCFYAECGGQVGDQGVVLFYEDNVDENKSEESSTGRESQLTLSKCCLVDGKYEVVFKHGPMHSKPTVGRFTVVMTENINGYVIHWGVLEGRATANAYLYYDTDARCQTMSNHTATHLLNYFLRTLFPTEQKGSLVGPKKFRFDFEGDRLTIEQIKYLEDNINKCIRKGGAVRVEHLNKDCLSDDIIRMKNEEYPDEVRVIVINDNIKEMCGGTHVRNIGDIKRFKILSEASISANTRRIVGVTGEEAEKCDRFYTSVLEELEKGQIVNIDRQIGILEKTHVDEMNKKNRLNAAEELKKYVNKKAAELELKAARLKSNESGNDFVLFEVENVTKREACKVLPAIIMPCMAAKVRCCVYVKAGNEFVVACYSNNLKGLVENLNDVFGKAHLRISKGVIQGVVVAEDFESRVKLAFK